MGLDIDHTARPAEMSRRKQTNPQSTKRTHENSDSAISDYVEKDEEFLEDNSEFNKIKKIDQQTLIKMNQDENKISSEMNSLKNYVNKKKRNNFCSSNNSSLANSPASLKEDDFQEEEMMEEDINEKNDNIKDDLKTIKTKRIKTILSLNNQEETENDKVDDEDEKKKDTMRALFSRLQGIDSESTDLLTVTNKKKKKMKLPKESKNLVSKPENEDEEVNEENDDNEEEDQEDNENNKNNVNNNLKSSLCKLSSDVNNENENSLCTDKKKSKKQDDNFKEDSKIENNHSESEEMQCNESNEDLNDDADEDDDKKNSSLNQSWSSSGSSKNNLKPNSSTKQLSVSPSNDLLSPTNDKTFVSNKKRKLNQQKTFSSTNNSKILEQQNNLAAAEMLAKYQSQFAQLSQQILLNTSSSNPINLASNENLMNSFLAAAASVNNNTVVPSPSPKPTSINTSSSLDKLSFIVDSIDKITVNQPLNKNSSNNNCLNTGTPTPGLSDSDNGSNLLLQLPTLSSLNKQAKTSPIAYSNSPATFQDVFNKLLPHQLLELQTTQLNPSSSTNLFQQTPIKSPSSSSTHSSHSSSPSPNFFAKFVSNSANSQVNSPAPTLSSFASTLSTFGLNKNLNNVTNSNSKKSNSSKVKNNSSINQNKQQNNLNNLLRQHAALALLQQTENTDDIFENLEKDNDENEEDDIDQLGINSILLKHLKKQMQKSKIEDAIGIAPLDLSCKRDETANSLNALIASKLIENGGLNALFNSSLNNSSFGNFNSSNNIAQLNQLNNLLSANNLLNSTSNQNSDKLNRIDLLSSLLGASSNTNSSTNLAAAAAAAATMSNPSAALLNFSLNQQLQNGPTNNTKNQKNSKESNQFKNQSLNAVSMLNNVLNSSNNSNLLSNATIAGHQLINPNSSNSSSSFWNNSKVKPYSASSSLHTPNPKSMQLRERSSSGQGRANPWQTQWMNRSSEQNRDVFTCVWCKMSFHSLDEMTQHMKVSPRCGMAGMQQANAVSVTSSSSSNVSSHTPDHKNLLSNLTNSNLINQNNNNSSNVNALKTKVHSSTSSSHNLSSSTSQFLNKEKEKSNSQVPRKLVRGQDVWLGRGAEQTRQILKCIWCQESFKTLDELSKHMHVTQHFMNIISPEQITSWKTPEEKTQQSQMNQVLACKVCDESFSSLKELSSHIQKTSHFKNNNHVSNKSEQKTSLSALASITDKDRQSPSGLSTTSSSSTTGGNVNANSSSNGDQMSNNSQKKRNFTSNSNTTSSNNTNSSTSKERRKKSLPVRKLLELERNVPLGNVSNGLSNRDKQNNSENSNLSRSFLESMNRLFGSSNNNEKSRNGYNMDNLSTHSDESENCSLNTSGNGNSCNNESNLNVNQSITCDECNEKMDFNQFIIHLKNCKPQFTSDQNEKLLNLIFAAAQQQQNSQCPSDNKSPETINVASSKNENQNEADGSLNDHTKFNGNFIATPKDSNNSRQGTPERSDSRQSSTSSIASGSNRGTPQLPNGLTLAKKNNLSNKTNTNKPKEEEKKNGSGSVISALEQLIEKSFDSKSKKSSTNLGILQRLGIDEEVCPPWQTNLTSATSPSSTTSSNSLAPSIAPNNNFYSWSP